MEIIVIFWILSVTAPLIHIFFQKDLSPAKIIQTFILYQLVFTVGFGGLAGYYAHVFRADETAEYIGWLPGNPFQQEVGYANLMLGLLGLLCIVFRGTFWTATILGFSIWYLANAYGHLKQLIVNQNFAPGNAGIPLYADIFLPLIILSLLVAYSMVAHEEPGNT